MFDETVIARKKDQLEKRLGKRLRETPVEDAIERVAALEGKTELSVVDIEFIENERHLSRLDFMYWGLRYMRIKPKTPGLIPWEPWESQLLVIDRLRELERTTESRNDGILVANNKARQLGASTVYTGILSWLSFFTPGFAGLLAADEPDQSEYLFNMMERNYKALPAFMQPHRKYHVKGAQLYFDKLDSLVVVDHGNRTVGDLGRGKTWHGVVLSELEKWQRPEQIDSGLLPGIPRQKSSFAAFESTGEYRNSWWHKFYMDAKGGFNRFGVIFIPWYSESNTYTRPAPSGWNPDSITMQHADLVERTSPDYMRGRTVRLDRDQLYFWEFTRGEYARRNKLGIFYSEYCATDEDAWRAANTSIFTHEIIEQLRQGTSFPAAYHILAPGLNQEAIWWQQNEARKRRTVLV